MAATLSLTSAYLYFGIGLATTLFFSYFVTKFSAYYFILGKFDGLFTVSSLNSSLSLFYS